MDDFEKSYSKYNERDGKNLTSSSGSESGFFRKMTLAMVGLCAVVAICTVISVVVSVAKGRKKVEQVSAENVVNVSTKEIKNEIFRETISLNAELRSRNGAVTVTAPVSGTLTENIARLGDRVKKGDMLGVVDASDIGVSYKQAPVYAKADGIVTAVSGTVNQKVAVAAPLYTIEPEPDYVLDAAVSEKDADFVDIEALGFFTTAGNKDKVHTAHVKYVAPSVTASNRTVNIQLEVDKDEENVKGLRSGNYVNLELINREYSDVFVLPKDAIKTYLNDTVVYVVDNDGIAHRVVVALGSGNESETIVADGLKAGDVVVVQGNPQDGDKVQIL